MGAIQSGINNILASMAVGASAIKGQATKEKEIKIKQEEAKKQEVKEAKEAKAKEKQDIADTQEKLSDARYLAMGYTQADLKKQKARNALGVNLPQKNPRGVGMKTFDRRMANAMAMEEIQNKYAQKADFRERLKGIKTKDLANAMKPEINKKQGGKK